MALDPSGPPLDLITSSHQMVEHKGIDPIRMPNYVRLLITSNEDWVVPAGLDERRFAVIEVSGHRAGDKTYFDELTTVMRTTEAKEALLFELVHWKIDDAAMRKPPDTEALWSQKLRSLNTAQLFLYEALREGEFEPRSGWPSWISIFKLHMLYRRHCETYGARRPLDRDSLCRQLRALLPRLSRKRRKVTEDDGTESARAWGYELPDLREAREQFDAAAGHQIPWEEAQ